MENKNKLKFIKIYTRSRWKILLDNLLGGIAWGVGSVIGATIIIWIISFIFVKTQKVPLIGDIIQEIVREVNESKVETKNILNDH